MEIEWYNKIDSWDKTILEKFDSKEINFSVYWVPWISWISKEKLRSLWVRWLLVWLENSEVIIPEWFKEFIEKFKKSTWDILELPKIIEKNSNIVDKNWIPYWYFFWYYNNLDSVYTNQEKLKQTEFFNNKYNFLNFVREKTPELLQEQTFFLDSLEEVENFFRNKNIWEKTYFIKSAIWASWWGTWKISTKEDFEKFKKDTKSSYNFNETIFDEDWKILQNLNYENWWKNIRKEKMKFVVQEALDTSKLEERSASFYFENWKINLITETFNYTTWEWEHEWNKQSNLPVWVREKISPLIVEISKNYNWIWWIDFFVDNESKKIYILEMNPRNTWATNPAILTKRIEQKTWEEFWWETKKYSWEKLWKTWEKLIIPQTYYKWKITTIIELNKK